MSNDVVPSELREQWVSQNWVPGQDVFSLFEEHVARQPECPAIIDDGDVTTYRELHVKALRFANLLVQDGVQPGDVIAVQLPNRSVECIVELGAAAAGAVTIAYPLLYRRHEVEMLLRRTNAVACVVPAEAGGFSFPSMVNEIASELPHLRCRYVSGASFSGFVEIEPLIGDGSSLPETRPDIAIASSDLVRLLVTSGTEGEPKISAFSHDAMAGGLGNYMMATSGGPGRRIFMMPALSSGAGGLMACVWIPRVGGTVVVTDVFSAERAIEVIRTHRPEHLFGVPSMFRMLTLIPDIDRSDLTSVEVIDSSGSANPPQLVEDLIALFDCTFVNHYGCTDGVMTYTLPTDPADKVIHTVGRPDPKLSSIRIVDDDGNDVPAGESGEIWGRGPQAAHGYFNNPELDLKYRTPDGWTHTGDVGFIDEEGYLHVVDRLKDIIIRGGYNISPAEIEAEILEYPGVAQAACGALDDERLGERVCLVVEMLPHADVPTLEELGRFLLARGMAQIKVPERIEVVDAMPMTASGKIRRQVLRTQMRQLASTQPSSASSS
jgi:acyl-CoA synthetase